MCWTKNCYEFCSVGNILKLKQPGTIIIIRWVVFPSYQPYLTNCKCARLPKTVIFISDFDNVYPQIHSSSRAAVRAGEQREDARQGALHSGTVLLFFGYGKWWEGTVALGKGLGEAEYCSPMSRLFGYGNYISIDWTVTVLIGKWQIEWYGNWVGEFFYNVYHDRIAQALICK